ncbi:nuclear inhibitor of protein phosphatase 1-like isoform X2 [Dendronephthya gigantea]|uniref:nuclear inhibitor of protein phosphatase 1-like isoform X2 n=1 Tax=Dendronephthya gigantea TaxID=151771 RepID=UPI00106B1547|nr:nuclear inhibitor of protein phosphatase 1-like isoform X2 [Dendronephthya gigantea]
MPSAKQKLIIDQKPFYLFGRNKDSCDFPLDHTSCSRVHSALVFHKHLNRPFLIDLKSTHGTFIGHIRLESDKPTQLPVESVIHFGASTRTYTLREKPTLPSAMQATMHGNSEQNVDKEDNEDNEGSTGGFLGLPESDTDLKDLTDFNTAHNKRLSSIAIEESGTALPKLKRRRVSTGISFKDGYEIINPEDVDPSVGKFRNMIQTSIVQVKEPRHASKIGSMTESITKRMNSFAYKEELYTDLPALDGHEHDTTLHSVQSGSRVTAAPDVEGPEYTDVDRTVHENTFAPSMPQEAPKKKYAKEAWPGKKHGSSLLM